MFERVLVAYDGSQPADAGLRFAAELSGAAGAHVTVLHVLSPGSAARDDAGSTETAQPGSLSEAEDWVAEVCRRHSAPGAPAMSPAVAEGGRPAAVAIDRAEQLDADLVIAGRSGRTALRRFLSGTVADRLIEYAPCSTAIFPDRPHTPARPCVMAAYDGSEPSKRALGVAADLASVLSAELRIVHVVDYRLPLAGSPPASARDLVRDHADEILREAAGGLAQPLDSVQTELRDADPRAGLLEAATEHRPALLVVGHRGTGGFAGLRIGSTAREVAAAAPVPVLIARPKP